MEKKHIQVNSVYADYQESTPWNKKSSPKNKKSNISSLIFFLLIILAVLSLSITLYFLNKTPNSVKDMNPVVTEHNITDKVNKDKWLQKQLNLANLPYLPIYNEDTDRAAKNQTPPIDNNNIDSNEQKKTIEQKPNNFEKSISEDLLIKYEPESFIEIMKDKMKKQEESKQE